MFNPLFLFETYVLDKLVESGNKFFVRQSYPRGKELTDTHIKQCFLISHYMELGNAQQHMSTLNNDPYAFLYEWDNPEHQQKLKIAASQPEGFKVYAALMHHQYKAKITDVLKGKLRDYIASKLKWYPKRGEQVVPRFNLQYGELFVTLHWRTYQVSVKFSDIEKGR